MVKYMPTTLEQALSVRAAEPVVPYAGGTDLCVQNKPGLTYLFLNKVPELKGITEDEDYIRIGACTTFTQALESPMVPALMKEAVSHIAAPAIRNAGTFGGNLGNGSAKADSVLIEYVLDAKLRIVSKDGERIVDVASFYKGNKELDLADNELIAEILLPKETYEYDYQKVGGRNALAISRISFAGVWKIEDGKITKLSIAFGAVSGTVLRFTENEEMLTGKTVQEARGLRDAFVKSYADKLVLTRGRVSAEYRKSVCMNLLNECLDRVLK
ncbi:MAG: FAD binding domain-containing protein [Lachnospiraceae bacterium]|nr:FAD binding domain-containing protein [Lachnospiraceae bacterium]